ncbi:MAG: anti-sigma factor antagonist, partial [Spartobacteria bacterium]|nr:anti-sigma factor antagonist [Spartobacteria bacterium]
CIECAGVPYISSAGLRVLMLAIRELSKRNETLRLTAVSPEVYHVLYLSGFTSLAQVEKTHE